MVTVDETLKLLPNVLESLSRTPDKAVWLSYDAEGDVLYIHFRPPGPADDSEMTDDDIIVRYAGDEVIVYTILHASRRAS